MQHNWKSARSRPTLALAIVAALTLPSPSLAQSASTYVMKLSTATVNDHQHEWLKRFAGGGRERFRRPDQGGIYPASQLGSIPSQIEGTQFGSIQGWIGPPEFLVGVDQRYEALSAPGLFANQAQAMRTINDPASAT